MQYFFFSFTIVLSFVHRQYEAYIGLTEYAGLSPTCSRILNGLCRVVGHSIRFHEYMPNNGLYHICCHVTTFDIFAFLV